MFPFDSDRRSVDCSSVTVEFQALIVRDVVILVVQIGNQFSARHVLRSDVVVGPTSEQHTPH